MNNTEETVNAIDILINNGLLTWNDILTGRSPEEKDDIIAYVIEKGYIDFNTWQNINSRLSGVDVDNNIESALEQLKSSIDEINNGKGR